MALIIEDGTGVTNANAYITAAEFATYASNRNEDISGYSATQIDGAIVVASADFISVNYQFKGDTLTDTQGMQLPSDQVSINRTIKQATCEATLLQLKGKLFVDPDLLSVNGKLQSVDDKLSTLGSAESYFKGTGVDSLFPTKHIDRMLSKYLSSGGYAPTSTKRY